MTAAVQHTEQCRRIDPGDECHVFCCCNKDLGLCGADLTLVPIAEGDEDRTLCPMCSLLVPEPCPWCGCIECEEEV